MVSVSFISIPRTARRSGVKNFLRAVSIAGEMVVGDDHRLIGSGFETEVVAPTTIAFQPHPIVAIEIGEPDHATCPQHR